MDIRSGAAAAIDTTEARARRTGKVDDDPVRPVDDDPVRPVDDDLEDLPARPVSRCRVVRKVRRMDDPEILQRVLAGLLTLP